jgi:non-specific serine/threonine protein kinase
VTRNPSGTQRTGGAAGAAGALPRPRTSFVGREREVAALRHRLLGGARLVTLTGPPGVGKTRLALEAAASLDASRAGTAYFVPLAAVRDPALVPGAIARALHLENAEADAGVDALAVVVATVASQRALLVLDNLEQVLAAATVVDRLLLECPRLAVLATSRAPLRLSGEQEFPVPPLDLPEHDATASAAVRLFVERAKAVRPDFELRPSNEAAVAAICRRLDGLPLAIELAAARIRLLSPEAMADQLGSRLDLLAGGPRDAPARQQTLRAAITWSYDLLAPAEQRLFRRFGIFAGGCTLAAAAAVCGDREDEASTEPDGLLVRHLEALAEHSLVAADTASERSEDSRHALYAEPRLAMLELIREYALERLAASGEETAVRARHARYFTAFAEAAEAPLRTAAQGVWLERFEQDHANLRLALEWLAAQTSAGDEAAAESGLRLAGALWWFWHLRGHNAEGRAWLAAFLDAPAAAAATTFRGRALFGAGFLAWSTCLLQWDAAMQEEAGRRFEESLALFRSLGDRHGMAYALWGIGRTNLLGAGSDPREQAVRESLDLFTAAGDLWGIVKAHERLGTLVHNRGARQEARHLWEEGLAAARALGEPQGLASALRQVGTAALEDGDLVTARALLEESAAALGEIDLLSTLPPTHLALGKLALAEGNLREAERQFLESHRAAQRRSSRYHSVGAMAGLGAAAAAAGEWERSLLLAGAAIALWLPATGQPGSAPLVDSAKVQKIADSLERYEGWISQAREAVGDERAGDLLVRGTRVPLDDLLGHNALTDGGQARSRLSRTDHFGGRAKPRTLASAAGPPSAHPMTGNACEGVQTPLLPRPDGATDPPPAALNALTPRERETAALIAAGLTNREIAAALIIAERTVMRHVEHILSKLDVRSRTQIAVWAVEHNVR